MPYRAQEVKENHIIEAICAGHLGSENGTELSLAEKKIGKAVKLQKKNQFQLTLEDA